MAIEKIVAGKEMNIPQARSLKNQKVKSNKRGIGATLYLASEALTLLTAVGFIGYTFLKEPVKNAIQEMKFRQAYSQAVEQYGDSNGDGLVSAQENKELFQNIFYKTGINFNSQGASYSDGRQVPTSELTKIIKDYIANPGARIQWE